MPLKNIMQRTCERCDITFERSAYDVKRYGGRFCSKRCSRVRPYRIVESLDFEGAALVPLHKGSGEIHGYALIDVSDAAYVGQWRWYRTRSGYVMRRKWVGNGECRSVLLHRELLGLAVGDPSEVDHINRNPLDCRRANLRIVTHAQNHQNRGSLPGSSSEHRGVSWNATRRAWVAYIHLDGKLQVLGVFECETDAASAARAARARFMPYATN